MTQLPEGAATHMAKMSMLSHDEKLQRIRNNQRRHRQRARQNVARLETKLAETELQLQESRSTIQSLVAKLEQTRPHACTTCGSSQSAASPPHVTQSSSQQSQTMRLENDAAMPGQDANSHDKPIADAVLVDSTSCEDKRPKPRPNIIPAENPTTIRQGTCLQIFLQAQPDEFQSGGGNLAYNEAEYASLAPPARDESTTRCRDAYSLIAGQNFRRVDRPDVLRRLQPGFRGPVAVGDGCRVENKALFEVLDHVTSD